VRKDLKSAKRKRSNFQQPLSKILKLKEMNPILKALLKLCTTKTLFKLGKNVAIHAKPVYLNGKEFNFL